MVEGAVARGGGAGPGGTTGGGVTGGVGVGAEVESGVGGSMGGASSAMAWEKRESIDERECRGRDRSSQCCRQLSYSAAWENTL